MLEKLSAKPVVNEEIQPRATEKQIQNAILDWLQWNGVGKWWRSQPPVARWREGGKTGVDIHRSEPGQPDITGCLDGRYIALEVKRPKAPMRQSQKDFRDGVEKNQGIYRVVRSVEEAQAVIEEVAG